MLITKREDLRGAQSQPRSPVAFEMSPLGLGDAVEDLTARLMSDEQDPIQLATRYALLVERARVLRMHMDRVSSALDCASQVLASRLAERVMAIQQDEGSVADLMAEPPGR